VKAITAADSKNAFGEFLDAVQREPVLVTEKDGPVGVMLSMRDVATLFGGAEDGLAVALEEGRLDDQIEHSRQQARNREIELADDAFFEARRAAIRAKMGAAILGDAHPEVSAALSVSSCTGLTRASRPTSADNHRRRRLDARLEALEAGHDGRRR